MTDQHRMALYRDENRRLHQRVVVAEDKANNCHELYNMKTFDDLQSKLSAMKHELGWFKDLAAERAEEIGQLKLKLKGNHPDQSALEKEVVILRERYRKLEAQFSFAQQQLDVAKNDKAAYTMLCNGFSQIKVAEHVGRSRSYPHIAFLRHCRRALGMTRKQASEEWNRMRQRQKLMGCK